MLVMNNFGGNSPPYIMNTFLTKWTPSCQKEDSTCSPPPLPSFIHSSNLKFSLPPLNLVSIHNAAAPLLNCNQNKQQRWLATKENKSRIMHKGGNTPHDTILSSQKEVRCGTQSKILCLSPSLFWQNIYLFKGYSVLSLKT